jgi:hypothetical protein
MKMRSFNAHPWRHALPVSPPLSPCVRRSAAATGTSFSVGPALLRRLPANFSLRVRRSSWSCCDRSGLWGRRCCLWGRRSAAASAPFASLAFQAPLHADRV